MTEQKRVGGLEEMFAASAVLETAETVVRLTLVGKMSGVRLIKVETRRKRVVPLPQALVPESLGEDNPALLD
jgi:hypothetical protein